MLKATHFAKFSRKSVENAPNAFGHTKSTPLKTSASRSFAQPDTFPTITESVLKSATFVTFSMPEETVWLVSQPTFFKTVEYVFKAKSPTHAHQDNIWVRITSAMKSAHSAKFTPRKEENVPNVTPTITSCTPENVSFKPNVNQDKSSLTTTVMTLAPLAETTTEQQENVSTVLQRNTNSITDFVSQFKPAESDNGLMTTEIATKSATDATLSTHPPVTVPAVSKVTAT